MMTKYLNKNIFLALLLLITFGLTGYYWYQDHMGEALVEVELVARNEANEETITLALENRESVVVPLRMAHVFSSDVDLFSKVEMLQDTPEPIKQKRKQKTMIKQVKKHPKPLIVDPQAPPLPFKYIGKLWGDSEFQVFLSYQGTNLVLKKGDYISSMYQVVNINPPKMVLNYLPMSKHQVLDIGQ